MGQAVLPPGFRFHPTDEELVLHYLKRKSCSRALEDGIIGEVDLYNHEPWDLPEKSALCSRDAEWYFFIARDNKKLHGSRTNRATKAGYWKGTGKDRSVCSGGCTVGMKKTLVFYLGRAPNGERTDWIMHEYRLDEEYEKKKKIVRDFVLCRIRKKSGPGPRNGEQYGAPVLDEENEIGPFSECSLTDVANRIVPRFSEDKVQQEYVDVPKQPGFIGGFETPSQVPNKTDSEGVVGSNLGERLDSFLEVLLTHEPQNESAAGSQNGLDSISKEGNSEAEKVSADYFYGVVGGSSVSQNEHNSYFEPLQVSAMQTVPIVPGLYAHGLENLHDILHPAPDEGEMLGEVLQVLTAGQGVPSPYSDSSAEQNDRMTLPAPAANQGLVSSDYLDFMQLPEEFLFTLPDLDISGFETDEGCVEPIIEDHNGIELRSRGKEIQEGLLGLHGHGTAAWRARLQMPACPLPPHDLRGSINDKDTLHPKELYTLQGQSPFSEEQMLTSGDLKDDANIKQQNTVNIDGGDATLAERFSGLSRASGSESSGAGKASSEDAISVAKLEGCIQTTRSNLGPSGIRSSYGHQCPGLGLADTCVKSSSSSSGDSLIVSLVNEGQADYVGSATFVRNDGVMVKQEYTVGIASAPGQDHECESGHVGGNETTHSMESPGTYTQHINPNLKGEATTLEAHPGLSSAQSSSALQLPKYLLKILGLLGDVPSSPVSAAVLSVEVGRSKLDLSKTLASVKCPCAGNEAEHIRATLLVRGSSISKSDLLLGTKLLPGLTQIEDECCSGAPSNHKIQNFGESATPIVSIWDYSKSCKTLCGALMIFAFSLATSALIFFCPFHGFWRLAKRALANQFSTKESLPWRCPFLYY